MKLVTKVTTALVALASLALFASCGSTDAAAAGAAAPVAGPSTTWEWDKIPLSDIGTSDTVIDERIEIAPAKADVAGAKFEAVAGKAKFKTEAMGTALYHGNKSSATLEGLKEVFVASYELTVAAPAKVTLVVSGNGDATPARCLAVYDAAGATLTSISNIGQDKKDTLTFDAAAAGVYKINLAGCRIYSVKVE